MSRKELETVPAENLRATIDATWYPLLQISQILIGPPVSNEPFDVAVAEIIGSEKFRSRSFSQLSGTLGREFPFLPESEESEQAVLAYIARQLNQVAGITHRWTSGLLDTSHSENDGKRVDQPDALDMLRVQSDRTLTLVAESDGDPGVVFREMLPWVMDAATKMLNSEFATELIQAFLTGRGSMAEALGSVNMLMREYVGSETDLLHSRRDLLAGLSALFGFAYIGTKDRLQLDTLDRYGLHNVTVDEMRAQETAMQELKHFFLESYFRGYGVGEIREAFDYLFGFIGLESFLQLFANPSIRSITTGLYGEVMADVTLLHLSDELDLPLQLCVPVDGLDQLDTDSLFLLWEDEQVVGLVPVQVKTSNYFKLEREVDFLGVGELHPAFSGVVAEDNDTILSNQASRRRKNLRSSITQMLESVSSPLFMEKVSQAFPELDLVGVGVFPIVAVVQR